MPIQDWVVRHFQRHLQRKPWDFCWRIAIESIVVSLIPAVLLAVAFGSTKRRLLDLPMHDLLILGLVLAPVIETLIFQAFPIFIVRMLKGAICFQIIASTILFSAAHFPEGISVGVSAGVIGGLYYAFAYAHWRLQSRWKAFWITTVCHFIHNGAIIIPIVVLGILSPDFNDSAKAPPDFAPQLNAVVKKLSADEAKHLTKDSFIAMLGAPPQKEEKFKAVWEIRYDDKNYDSLSVKFDSSGHATEMTTAKVRSSSN